MSTSATPSSITCRYCGGVHVGECPRVKAIDYYPDGTVKRVELHEYMVTPFGVSYGPAVATGYAGALWRDGKWLDEEGR